MRSLGAHCCPCSFPSLCISCPTQASSPQEALGCPLEKHTLSPSLKQPAQVLLVRPGTRCPRTQCHWGTGPGFLGSDLDHVPAPAHRRPAPRRPSPCSPSSSVVPSAVVLGGAASALPSASGPCHLATHLWCTSSSSSCWRACSSASSALTRWFSSSEAASRSANSWRTTSTRLPRSLDSSELTWRQGRW